MGDAANAEFGHQIEGTPSIEEGVMLRRYGTVLFGMNPRLNRSTSPEGAYLLGLMMITRSIRE